MSATRKPATADPVHRRRTTLRLRRIEGQVRGLQQMVEDERPCPEVLVQMAAVQEALRGVARELMREHLRHCAADAFRSGPKESTAMIDELVDLMHRHAR
jgi:CsoR family transcriptional regulator, copper-sensing transcriptional repressor